VGLHLLAPSLLVAAGAVGLDSVGVVAAAAAAAAAVATCTDVLDVFRPAQQRCI
jgi:hypothetical protein